MRTVTGLIKAVLLFNTDDIEKQKEYIKCIKCEICPDSDDGEVIETEVENWVKGEPIGKRVEIYVKVKIKLYDGVKFKDMANEMSVWFRSEVEGVYFKDMSWDIRKC